MLTPKVYIPQVGILSGYKVLELDLRYGILVRRLKAADIAAQIQAAGNTQYVYLQLSHGNLQDKTLKKLLEHLATLCEQLYISTNSNVADGLANILHTLHGVELNFANPQPQTIERICLLAAARRLQLNITLEQAADLAGFLPLFSQLKLANINIYLPSLENIGELPDNVRVFNAIEA